MSASATVPKSVAFSGFVLGLLLLMALILIVVGLTAPALKITSMVQYGRRDQGSFDDAAVTALLADPIWLQSLQDRVRVGYGDGSRDARPALFRAMGRTGRVWHRMYPHSSLSDLSHLEARPKQYVELLTVFPYGSQKSNQFLSFLRDSSEQPGNFQHLW